MGIARKIKVGARRVALDRAEEARLAAFSAYEALGVQVPEALALPIVNTLDDDVDDDEVALVAPAIACGTMTEALHDVAELKAEEVPTGTEIEAMQILEVRRKTC